MEATPGICASCDRRTFVYDVGAYDFSLFCKPCRKRYGDQNLKEVANAALSMREQKTKDRTCLRCGSPLIAGSRPMCQNCEGAYRERFGTTVKWM